MEYPQHLWQENTGINVMRHFRTEVPLDASVLELKFHWMLQIEPRDPLRIEMLSL